MGKLEAPFWCTTQQEEGLWIQGVNVMVPQRRVFVCASELDWMKAFVISIWGLYTTKEEVQRRDFHGVIDPLLSWRESIGRKRSRGGGECKGKLQVPRQGGRAEAKELHKTSVDRLLIKITDSKGLRVDARVLD
ncbi:hypothetical protein BHM03_00028692 [Ensete ventricosum]|nr:hypothetical protein BHM03_00028692 [Ensete ventricosum]